MAKKLSVFILILFTLLAFSQAQAQVSADKKEKKKNKNGNIAQQRIHKKIIVTATMSEKAVKDCSADVAIVDHRDIDSIFSSSAFNLLQHLPGLFSRRTGDFGRADVDIRGLGQRGRRIAVLIDGRPEKMGLFGCAVSHSFPLDNVDRIEVVKGPSSVLYGSEALGGVINILTRQAKKKSETALSAAYGSYNTQQYNLRHGGKFKTFDYYFTADRRLSDGHIKNSNYSGYAFTGRTAWSLSPKLKISLQGKYFWGNKHEAGPVKNPLENFWNRYQRGAIDLSLAGRTKTSNFMVKIYRNSGSHTFSDGWDSTDYINGGIIRYTTHRIKNNELTLGGDFRFLGGESFAFPIGSWQKGEGAIFIHNETIIKKRWIFSSGLRLHYDSLYGTETAPHLGLVFQVSPRLSFRGVVNKGFRSPQLNELFMYPPANPELEPERVWNYELGVQKTIFHFLSLKGAVFYMRGSNLIETSTNPFPPPQYLFMNTGKFSFFGYELALALRLTHLNVSISYSHLNTGNISKGRPGEKIDLNGRFIKGGVTLSFQCQYVSDYFAANFFTNRLPSYFLVNSHFAFRLHQNLELYVDLNNILDRDYMIFVELPGIASGSYIMPGRNIHIGFRLNL